MNPPPHEGFDGAGSRLLTGDSILLVSRVVVLSQDAEDKGGMDAPALRLIEQTVQMP